MNDLCRPPCRCVTCTQCGATTPGLRCEWQKNYTQCAPCASLVTCPICLVDYSEGATILQCRQCDRWAPFLHTRRCLSVCTPVTRLLSSHPQVVPCLLPEPPLGGRCGKSCRKWLQLHNVSDLQEHERCGAVILQLDWCVRRLCRCFDSSPPLLLQSWPRPETSLTPR